MQHPSSTPVPAVSDTVRVLPGMSADTVLLSSYRHDGTVFIRIELPAELAPAWVARLERYTKQHDTSAPRPLALVP